MHSFCQKLTGVRSYLSAWCISHRHLSVCDKAFVLDAMGIEKLGQIKQETSAAAVQTQHFFLVWFIAMPFFQKRNHNKGNLNKRAICKFCIEKKLLYGSGPGPCPASARLLLWCTVAGCSSLIASFALVRSDECPLIGFQFYSLRLQCRIRRIFQG